jgi:hypothetical protein
VDTGCKVCIQLVEILKLGNAFTRHFAISCTIGSLGSPRGLFVHGVNPMQVTWRIIVLTGESKHQQTVGEYDTKREAVYAMESRRKPKTRVTRWRRDYIFEAR